MNPIIEEIIAVCKNFDVPEARKYLEKFEIRFRDDKEIHKPEQTQKTGTCTSIPAEPYELGDAEKTDETNKYERMNLSEPFLEED